MRTTVTLDADVEAHVRRLMRERGLTFKQALNDAVRRGFEAAPPQRPAVVTPTFSMGEPTVPLDGALRLAADLEDEELVRRLAQGS
jgi:hypothetical protein